MARPGAKDRGLFERPRGSRVWWIRYVDQGGREHRERIGAKGLARRVYEKRKTEIREGRYFPPERHRAALFEEILADYQAYQDASGRRVQNTDIGLRRLREAFRGRRADRITRPEIEALQARLREMLAPATVNRHLVILKAAFNRAIRAEKVTINPVRGVRLFKENNIRVRYVTEDEEARLLEALPERFRPLALVAIHTGMRQGELLRLRWEDVDFYSDTLTVRQAKSGEGRRLPMNRVARETLLALRQERIREARAKGDGREILSPYVFCAREGGYLHNLRRAWRPAVGRAELEDFRFHDLRHTFASRLVMRGVDLYRVQTLLGHKTPTMTLRYAHLSPGHLREAVEALASLPPSPAGAGSGAGSRVNLGGVR